MLEARVYKELEGLEAGSTTSRHGWILEVMETSPGMPGYAPSGRWVGWARGLEEGGQSAFLELLGFGRLRVGTLPEHRY